MKVEMTLKAESRPEGARFEYHRTSDIEEEKYKALGHEEALTQLLHLELTALANVLAAAVFNIYHRDPLEGLTYMMDLAGAKYAEVVKANKEAHTEVKADGEMGQYYTFNVKEKL